MKLNWLFTILVAAVLLVGLVGCEGPEGPQGEKGDQGEQGPPLTTYTYLGDDAETCNHCHGDVVSTWFTTHHHEAYEELEAINMHEDPECLQCHTTGWDADVSDDEVPVITPGPDLSGFDDFWPPETDEDEMRIEALKNVQCEACHGPMGPTIYDHAPIVNFNYGELDDTDPSMCAKCHVEQLAEWVESGHGMVFETHGFTSQEEFDDEWNRSSCAPCHTGEGFVIDNDPYWATEELPEEAHLIACQTCHDPHDKTNEHQLRNLDDYSNVYTVNLEATYTGYGVGQICVQCHHARRDNDNVTGQIEEGYAHFGPHGSPQMDMFIGAGSYEIEGYTYERDHDHQAFDLNEDNEACVTCHMEMIEREEPGGPRFGHNFEPTPGACDVCHAVPDDFDYHGEPSSLDELAADLIAEIGIDPEELGDPEVSTMEQRMAGYAYVFFMNDGSHGIHNPNYARSLLENALEFMQTVNARNGGPIAQK